RVNGAHTGGGAYTINSGGALGGSGSTASSVSVLSGGILAPGNSIGTVTTGPLSIDTGVLNYEFAAPSSSDLTSVIGALTFANISSLNITDLGGLAVGTYNLFTYTGSLTGFTPTSTTT